MTTKKLSNKIINISRKISLNNLLAFLICCWLIIIALSIFNLAVYSYFQSPKFFGVKIEMNVQADLLSKKNYWIEFLDTYPNYLPGWVELAKIEVQLENVDSAIDALNSASSINPNSTLIINTKKELGLLLP